MNRGSWIILLSFMVALLLEIMPLPTWAAAWRPAWVVMTLTYWCMALPHRVGVFSAWSVGLFHDVLTDTLIGQHALGYSVVAWLVLMGCRQVRVFPMWQQSVVVFVLVLISGLPGLWLRGMLKYGESDAAFLYPALTSVLLWHWMFVLLRDIRLHFKIPDER